MSIKCCYGCVAPKRHTACWGHCPDYLAEKAADDAEKADYKKNQAISNGIYSSRSAKVNSAMRRRRHKKQ